MTVEIIPSKAGGTVKAPPSKSMAHRLLICAGLSKGESVVRGVSASEDIKATLDCLSSLGASWNAEGSDIYVTGTSEPSVVSGEALHCRESGSTLRFFVPLALLSGKNTVLEGSRTLLSRPLGVYADICREKKLLFSQDGSSVVVKGPLPSGTYTVPGNISSQFISGLLFALPLAKGDSEIHILPPVESSPYINLTVRALEKFGVKTEHTEGDIIKVKGNSVYSPADVSVEGDWSNAAFFAALNELGGNVKITGLDENSLQGDKIFTKHFESLSKGTPVIHIGDCPDLAPVLFAVAAAKYGGVFTGTRRLKIKESDRAECMAQELRKFGTAVTVRDDSVIIFPKEFHAPSEHLYGHNDHRIVMALSVLSTVTGGIIDGAEAVSKSFPDFFERLGEVGIEVKCSEI